EGLRPLDSPPRALARRVDGSLRSRGSLRGSRSLRKLLATLRRGASPLGLPSTRSRAPRRRLAPIAWLAARCSLASEITCDLTPRGFAPWTPLHALSRAASTARSDRVARCAVLARFGNYLRPYAEGLRPLDSPPRALARRVDGSLRSRGSLRGARSLRKL